MKKSISFGLGSLGPLAVLLSASFSPAVNANFDLYSGWYNQIFDTDPDCNQVLNTEFYRVRDDVSGDKLGVRCWGSGCSGAGDPIGIEGIEMHFSNDPLYHWTIYKNGNYDMIGLDGKMYGHCILFPAKEYFCTTGYITMVGYRKFRCLTQFSSGQITAGRKRGLSLDQLAAEYNITGAIGPQKPREEAAKREARRWIA